MPLRNGVPVATKNPNKKPVWEMTLEEQKSGKHIVFDFDELLEFAEGDIAPVFGPDFKIIDNYKRRVRLPAREYLLVSRVTKMDAKPGEFNVGGSMVTEYDLPVNGELSLGGDVPWAILVESGQCDLMLISYMGIDFQCKSDRVYRLLDTTLIFYGVATEGETLEYDIKVNGFAKGRGGEISMFFFEYNCYCNGKLLIEMRNGCAGFFTNEELAAGKGVVRTNKEIEEREALAKKAHEAKSVIEKMMLNPCWGKTTFSPADMQKLVNKQWGDVLGASYALDYRLTTPKMLMIDQITHLDPYGGIYGLGLLVGEKFLDPNHWYFPCHFVKDEVMAGSLVSDGCSQLLKVYLMWLGLGDLFDKFQFRPVDGMKNKVRCRGQISPQHGKLMYIMEIREIGFGADGLPYAIADVDIIDVDYDHNQKFEWSTKADLISKLDQYGKGDLSKKIVVDFKGIALQMKGDMVSKKSISNGVAHKFEIPPPPGCLKNDSNPPKQAVWHPYFDILKKAKPSTPLPSFFPSDFPPRAINFVPFLKNKMSIAEARKLAESKSSVDLTDFFNPIDLNFTPGEFPLNFYNMCEFMCGNVSNCLGDEFSIFDVSKTSRSPAFDLAYVSRVVKIIGLTKKNVMKVDVDPGVGEMIAEFDVPADAWFFDGSHMPFSVLMEIALQTSGILTSVLKAPLTMKKKDILFRNLDASSEMSEKIRSIDLRGKTIINRSKCMGYTMLGSMGIHRFSFELYVKEKDGSQTDLKKYIENYEKEFIDDNKIGCFYKGETSFGWFVPEVFENQVGLDGGKKTSPRYVLENQKVQTFSGINSDSGRSKFVGNDAVKSGLLRKSPQTQFLDEINIGADGSYMHGKKTVDPKDWFFSCHFWNDPVMPGSLGIESMIQLMEYYAIHNEVYKKIASDAELRSGQVVFQHPGGATNWKYRGQLTTKNNRMDSEITITGVNVDAKTKSIEITADGFLLVDNLRVYETKDLRLLVVFKSGSNGQINGSNGHQKPLLSSNQSNKLSFNHMNFSSEPSFDVSSISTEKLRSLLLDLEKGFSVMQSNGKPFEVLPVGLENLGDKSFMEFYGVKANLYSGAMAKGIASPDLVIAMGKANMLGSLGAGGLPMHVVEKALVRIKEELGNKPFAVNLIHSPFDPNLEEGNVELFKKYGVKVAEASAFMSLTPSVVLFRARGLSLENGNTIVIENKLIAKCSRTEVASQFLQPAPLRILDALLRDGKITQIQHKLAQLVPIADDVSVEADSGGHTDNRQIQVILPLVINLRNDLFKKQKADFAKLGETYKIKTTTFDVSANQQKDIEIKWPLRVRVGGGGGIGCPQAALCAISLGAAFLVTGTINQLCRESGTCDQVRQYLSEATYSDVTMAPAADMFDQGVQLQVLKKGTMFPSRAKKLYDLFCKYDSFEAFPEAEMVNLEKRIFKRSLEDVWAETKDFYINRLHNQEKIDKVEIHGDQKLKMSLCMRWYLGLSSFWANSGSEERKTDYQIWCGPAIGAFNEFINGSRLDPKVSGVYPKVVEANLEVLKGAAFLARVNQLRFNSKIKGIEAHDLDTEIATYRPQ